jgi:hypothetical protein
VAYLQISPKGAVVMKLGMDKGKQKFETKYHTEPRTNKTICGWYQKCEQSGCGALLNEQVS